VGRRIQNDGFTQDKDEDKAGIQKRVEAAIARVPLAVP
jgi:hypothetical protein